MHSPSRALPGAAASIKPKLLTTTSLASAICSAGGPEASALFNHEPAVEAIVNTLSGNVGLSAPRAGCMSICIEAPYLSMHGTLTSYLFYV